MIIRRLLTCGVAAVLAAAVPVPPAAASAPQPPGPCAPVVPCKLSVSLPDGDVLGAWTSPNSAWVVFLHRAGDTGPSQLYGAPVEGGASPVKLNTAATQSAGFLAISPDSTRVLYTGIVAGGARALFSVPIAGPATAGVRLAGAVGSGFTHAQISPDSRKVVYLPPSRDRLLAVPIAGPSAARRLTDPLVTGGSIPDFAISANSGSVVYRANQDVASATELYRVPLTLSPQPDPPTVKLNAPFVAGRHVLDYRLAPDDGPVVYRADQETDGVVELYGVRLGGSGRTKISLPLPTDWIVTGPMQGGAGAGWISPDGRRVVYRIQETDFDGQPQLRLYSVPIAGPGTASVRLDDAPSGTAADARVLSYRFTADSARVVYTMADDDDGTTAPMFWLLSVPTAGPAGAGVVLSIPSAEGDYFVLSPDGRYVLWLLSGGLFRIPVAGGAHVRLNGTESPDLPILVSADSTRVAYETSGADGSDLFSVPMSGTGTRFVLTETLDGRDISWQTLTAGGQHAVYTARRGPDGGFELFSSRLVPSVLPPAP